MTLLRGGREGSSDRIDGLDLSSFTPSSCATCASCARPAAQAGSEWSAWKVGNPVAMGRHAGLPTLAVPGVRQGMTRCSSPEEIS